MGLFKPVWMTTNEEKALKAIAKLKKQKDFAAAANNAPNGKVRLAAAQKLSDPVLICEYLIKGKHPLYNDSVGRILFNKIADKALLLKLVKSAEDKQIRYGAVDRITDQTTLYELSQTSKDSTVRLRAVYHVTDRAVLQSFLNDRDTDIRRAAILTFNDQGLLEDMAMNDNDRFWRERAVECLTDQETLTRLTQSAKDYDVRCIAYSKLPNHNPEIVKMFKEISVHGNPSLSFRSDSIYELIALLERDRFAARIFWPMLRYLNYTSSKGSHHDNGSSEPKCHTDYNGSDPNTYIENFPPYPFED